MIFNIIQFSFCLVLFGFLIFDKNADRALQLGLASIIAITLLIGLILIAFKYLLLVATLTQALMGLGLTILTIIIIILLIYKAFSN